MRMVAVKPVFHSLLMMYWHLLTLGLLDELDDTELDFELELIDELTELLDLTLDTDELELSDDETELLDFTLDIDDELELVTTLLELVLPTMPYGAGCAAQVLAAIQLLPFS